MSLSIRVLVRHLGLSILEDCANLDLMRGRTPSSLVRVSHRKGYKRNVGGYIVVQSFELRTDHAETRFILANVVIYLGLVNNHCNNY